MDKLLTVDQVADYLNISPHTVAMWRSRRYGPPYIVTGSVDTDKAPGHAAKQGIRYRLSDIDAWITAKTLDPETTQKPPHLSAPPHQITDEEWKALVAAFTYESLTDPASLRRRELLDAILTASCTGAWPPLPDGYRTWTLQARSALDGRGWLLLAFQTLGRHFPDFPCALVTQTVVVYRRGKERQFGSSAYRIRTDSRGALASHGMYATLASVESIKSPE